MNRREFLTGAPAAVLALTGCATATQGRRWRPRLTTSSIHFKDLPVERACERIAALGFEGVDLWSGYEGCPHLDDALNRLGPDGLKGLLARLGLRQNTFSTYVGGYAKYAALLGGIGGGVAVQGSAHPCPPAELSVRMKAFFEDLKPLAELAERHHSWLAIENHGDALLDALDSFKAFADLNPFKRVGIALAPYHLQARGESVEEAIRISRDRLYFFYAWQKVDGLAQLPGHGPTDFRPWMSALRETGYQLAVNPFMHGHVETGQMAAALVRSRDYLKALA